MAAAPLGVRPGPHELLERRELATVGSHVNREITVAVGGVEAGARVGEVLDNLDTRRRRRQTGRRREWTNGGGVEGRSQRRETLPNRVRWSADIEAVAARDTGPVATTAAATHRRSPHPLDDIQE